MLQNHEGLALCLNRWRYSSLWAARAQLFVFQTLLGFWV